MSHSLFIRTYYRDLPWLHELFRSIDKFVTGFDIVVHCDAADVGRTLAVLERSRSGREVNLRSSIPVCEAGYLNQQAQKLMADKYCLGDFITFVDSDCIFTAPTTPEHFMVAGKPQILHTSYATLGGTVPWKQPTDAILKRDVPHEFMRGMRLTYPREVFERFRQHIAKIHNVQQPIRWLASNQRLSEFNVLGAYCWFHEHDRISWLDTEREPLPVNNVRQFWSYSMITPEARAEIEAKLA
jgi:hypothetical protein